MTTAVLDVGKTHVKLNVVDEAGTVVGVARRANTAINSGLYPHFDVDGIFYWLLASLQALQAAQPPRRLICTTHGAAAALIRGRELALPVMDYEWLGPGIPPQDYETARDPFALTLSPSLPAGLNLARQLSWQAKIAPAAYAASEAMLPYPQYWAWRLCGVRAAEISSLGSHTDLWRPLDAKPSALAHALGIAQRLPEIRPAGDVLAQMRGAHGAIDVHCGVHDSSAAYIAQCPDPAAPGVVVSTGTWIVCMAPARDVSRLDPARDVSGTVSVYGVPLACSRFMGGREYEALVGADAPGVKASVEDLSFLLSQNTFALPAFAAAGPFQSLAQRGVVQGPAAANAGQRSALAALYCALVTDVCLQQIDAHGPIIVDGPFATNDLYLGVLAALRYPDSVTPSAVVDGPTIGAAMIATGSRASTVPRTAPAMPQHRDAVLAYRERWQLRVANAGQAAVSRNILQ